MPLIGLFNLPSIGGAILFELSVTILGSTALLFAGGLLLFDCRCSTLSVDDGSMVSGSLSTVSDGS